MDSLTHHIGQSEDLTMGGLFSGIGGFELAAQWTGIKPVWSNEIDSFCCNVLRKNFDHEVIEKDIRECGKHNLRPVDIICGGFPCQPFSNAGKRKGTSDDRYLWPEMLRVISEVRPTYVIGENVAGLVSMENSTPFERWLLLGMESKSSARRIYSRYIYSKRQTYVLVQIIKSIEKEGYQVEVYRIPACSVGAWHRRDRIWIVAHADFSLHKGELVDRGDQEETGGSQEGNTKKRNSHNGKRVRVESGECCEDAADTNQQGLPQPIQRGFRGIQKKNGSSQGGEFSGRDAEAGLAWKTEPDVGRVAHGVSGRVDRLESLGNAIVPQVAFEIFKAIKIKELSKQGLGLNDSGGMCSASHF